MIRIHDVQEHRRASLVPDFPAHRLLDPHISGNIVVYDGWHLFMVDVYYIDLNTGQEQRRVSFTKGEDISPKVSGGIITWSTCSLTSCVVFAYDWSTGQTSQVTLAVEDSRRPDVSQGSIVYQSRRIGEIVDWDIVHFNLLLSSALATVTVSTCKTPPVADAGPDQAVIFLNSLVTLDGSKSYDANGDPLT